VTVEPRYYDILSELFRSGKLSPDRIGALAQDMAFKWMLNLDRAVCTYALTVGLVKATWLGQAVTPINDTFEFYKEFYTAVTSPTIEEGSVPPVIEAIHKMRREEVRRWLW